MANLRELLGKEYKSTLDFHGSVQNNLHTGKVFWFRDTHTCCQWNCGMDAYGRQWMFCVPEGTCKITFEAWGGGGGSPSTCCCSVGTPGTTGAYVRKTMPASAGSFYCVCVGGHRGNNNDHTGKRGIQGCWTTICGPGVTICAPGGYGGIAFCDVVRSATMIGQDTIDFSAEAAAAGYQCYDCGPTGYVNSLPGHENEIIDGRPGYVRFHCANNCAVKWLMPYPPRITNDNGGWITYTSCADTMCATPQIHNSIVSMATAMPYSSMEQAVHKVSPPAYGVGGNISSSSTCMYGSQSTGGMVRITAWGDEKGIFSDCCYSALHFCQ